MEKDRSPIACGSTSLFNAAKFGFSCFLAVSDHQAILSFDCMIQVRGPRPGIGTRGVLLTFCQVFDIVKPA
jgi:hypothetical protein